MRISAERLGIEAEATGEVSPALITDDERMADRITWHPMLQRKALNVQQYRAR